MSVPHGAAPSGQLPDDFLEQYGKTETQKLNLKEIGCSDLEGDTISVGEVRDYNSGLSWTDYFLSKLFGMPLAITLAISLAVYGLVRAIGWVIGGFARS
jgi:hypothetical protein